MYLDAYRLETPFEFKLVAAPAQRDWMDRFPDRHPYRCLPMAVANTYGWWVLNPIEIQVVWNGGPNIEDLEVTSPDCDNPELVAHVARSNFSQGIVTFHVGHIFRTDEEHALLAMGALNYTYKYMTPLVGITETSWLPYPFTFNYRLHSRGTYLFDRGMPICQIVPIQWPPDFGTIEPKLRPISANPQLDEDHRLLARSRDEYMKVRATPWQKAYFTAKLPEGSTTQPGYHTAKVRMLAPIEDDTPVIESPMPVQRAPDMVINHHDGPLTVYGLDRDADTALGEICIVHDLVSEAEARLLCRMFEANPRCRAPIPDEFFNGRVMWLNSVPVAGNLVGLSTAETVRRKAREHVRRHFAVERDLGDDGPQIVKWPAGYEMPPHADAWLAPDEPNATWWRMYAGVLYLNEDYVGGYLYLPNAGIAIKPKRGLFVGFRGGFEHMHGVSKILEGDRYTMPMWFTVERDRWAPVLYQTS